MANLYCRYDSIRVTQIIPKYFEFISMILRGNFILIGDKNTIFAQLLHLIVLVIFDREKCGWPKSISNFYSRQGLASISQVGFRVINISKLVLFYKNWGFYSEDVWLWRISGGYSKEMKGLVLDRADFQGLPERRV